MAWVAVIIITKEREECKSKQGIWGWEEVCWSRQWCRWRRMQESFLGSTSLHHRRMWVSSICACLPTDTWSTDLLVCRGIFFWPGSNVLESRKSLSGTHAQHHYRVEVQVSSPLLLTVCFWVSLLHRTVWSSKPASDSSSLLSPGHCWEHMLGT